MTPEPVSEVARPGRFDPVLDEALDPEGQAWVDGTLAMLDLRAAAAQLIIQWMPGAYVSPTEEAFQEPRRWVEEERIGGIYLSIGNPYTFAAISNELQARARVPLLVTSDLEDGGPGMRLNHSYALPGLAPQGGGTAFPPTMAVGATGSEALARSYGKVTGREARAVGVHLNFAPVLDVNSNPSNPVIGTRAFGGEPEMVARLGTAYLAGLAEGGALSTAKHFPGHGDTREDSHETLPVVQGDRVALAERELVPFRAAIGAGVDAVMTAHVALPDLLGPDAPPATLAPEVLTGLLREELGFTGLVVTDALQMAAVAEGYGPGEATVRALEAGSDILLMPEDIGAALDAIEAAVAQGRLRETRIRASAHRVLTAKARAGLHRERYVDLEAVDDVVGSRAHRAVADSVAVRSLVLLRDPAGVFGTPPKDSLDILSVTVALEWDLPAGRTLDAGLRDAGHRVTSIRLEPDVDASEAERLQERLAAADQVVLGVYLPTRVGTSRDVLSPALRAVLRQAARTRPTLAVLLGSPYVVASLPPEASILLAWGGREISQRAASRAFLGQVDIQGRLPVTLPTGEGIGEGATVKADLRATAGVSPRDRGQGGDSRRSPPPFAGEADPASVGLDAEALRRVDSLLDSAVAAGAVPGATLAVGRHGRVVRLRAFGVLDPADSTRVTAETRFDIASMTKVVGTTSAVMMLVDEGLLDLADRVVDHLPWWSRGDSRKESVTVRQLLIHRAGLPPFRRWYLEIDGREAYREAIADEPLEADPGTATVYSDIGIMTLELLVREISGQPLDTFLEERLFTPLGMAETGFNPDPGVLDRVAPTEVDTAWRGGLHVRGIVHDENADAYGGVSGHAGLFSTARELAAFAQVMLDGGVAGPCDPGVRGAPCLVVREGAGLRLFDEATVARFTTRVSDESSRALGWDTPGGRSSAGDFLTEEAFGHTGFTGTSIWIDPELDLFVVFLTNRVNPTRANTAHVSLRRAVHDAVAQAITDQTVSPREGTR
jgi:beta-glucosidase-like glycosyl hydrolase/CubicO group peptidase (beta-lactamase class C family)